MTNIPCAYVPHFFNHWNVNLNFLLASLFLFKEKIGFLEMSSVRSSSAKVALIYQLLLPTFHSQNNKPQPQSTSGSILTFQTTDAALLSNWHNQGPVGWKKNAQSGCWELCYRQWTSWGPQVGDGTSKTMLRNCSKEARVGGQDV